MFSLAQCLSKWGEVSLKVLTGSPVVIGFALFWRSKSQRLGAFDTFTLNNNIEVAAIGPTSKSVRVRVSYLYLDCF